MLNWNVFREYDVRGLADRDLTDEFAYSLGRAYGALLSESKGRTVAVGRDVRDSSPRLSDALSRGLIDSGLQVMDVGIVPTPGLYFAVVHLRADGGIMVTGSHNPIEYNGFKMQVGTASLHGHEIRALGERIERSAYVDGTGSRVERPIAGDYAAMIVGKCRPERPLKIVLDAGNGVAGPPALEIFRALGHEITPLYCEPDGRFPNHQPDPTVEANMLDLMAKVREVGADLGCGYDGDADRIGVVDETGRLLWGDQLLALMAREVLRKLPGSKIVYDVKCSQGLEEDIRAHGGVPIMWKTGHSLTKAKMKEEHAPLAGEMSGHMFYQDDFFGHDDAIYASARFAAYLARSGERLSSWLDSLPRYVNSPEVRIECPDDRKFEIVSELAARFKERYPVIDIDGARVTFEDGWGLVRASNTQPVLVLRFEAKSEESLRRIRDRFRDALVQYPEVRWQD